MANEQELDIDSESIGEPETIIDEQGNDVTDWKALALKNHGIVKRFQTKLKKFKEAPAISDKVEGQSQNKTSKKKDFDYAEKAYLTSAKIEKDYWPRVIEAMNETGKTLDEVLDSKYFQAELNEFRSEKASQEAIPIGSKRSGGSARDSVEYWIAKGELPPIEQVELRRKVVNAKLKAETQGTKFSKKPVV